MGPKTGKVKGRTCLNLSKCSRNFRSVNDCVDSEASVTTYKRPSLPLLPDIAEMACRQRDELGHRELAGATVDVTSAYHQFGQSVETAKYQATLLRIPSPCGGSSWMQIVIIYLVGIFGFKIAGDIYCMLGDVVTQKHNLHRPVPRSMTYIDDGILIDARTRIQNSLAEYIALVRDVFGPDGVNMDKVCSWDSKLVAIGWEFDFDAWRVQPKARGLAKLIHFLFVVIPMGSTTVHERDLERLCGLLNWYAPGIPAGSAFIASLFRDWSQFPPRSSLSPRTPRRHVVEGSGRRRLEAPTRARVRYRRNKEAPHGNGIPTDRCLNSHRWRGVPVRYPRGGAQEA